MSPPLPKTEPPNDPPYEIIEFSSQQQYSNTPPFITKQSKFNKLDQIFSFFIHLKNKLRTNLDTRNL